jgi:Putative Flp pilus-assembly TadE/G-like
MLLHRSATSGRGLRRAAVVPLVAVSLIAILGFAAIVLEGGLLMDDHRSVQAAADVAAWAGATGLSRGDTETEAEKSGKTTALSLLKNYYGITSLNDGSTNTVTITAYPGLYQAGPNKGKKLPVGGCEAIVTYNRQRNFSQLFGSGTLPVAARAVAKCPAVDAGILVLDPTHSNALTTTNTADIVVKGAAIIVDSSSSTGGTASNTGTVSSDKQLIFSGGYSPPSMFTAPTILTNQPPTPDPLAALQPPPKPASTFVNVNISGLPSGTPAYGSLTDANTFTFDPGVYSGGIHISDNNSAHTYIFAPGTYWFTNGGLSLTANANIIGNNVLLYFNDGGSMSLTAGGSLTLTPPATGDYAGITVFQKQDNTSQPSITGQSTGSLNISGTFYAAAGNLSITGAGGNYALGSQYIVNQLKCTGSGTFNVTYNANAGSPTIAMVE